MQTTRSYSSGYMTISPWWEPMARSCCTLSYARQDGWWGNPWRNVCRGRRIRAWTMHVKNLGKEFVDGTLIHWPGAPRSGLRWVPLLQPVPNRSRGVQVCMACRNLETASRKRRCKKRLRSRWCHLPSSSDPTWPMFVYYTTKSPRVDNLATFSWQLLDESVPYM